MNTHIRHEGIIDSIDGEHVQVRIVQMSACASCHAASKCVTSESKVKIVDLWLKDSLRYKIGQKVVVLASDKVGMTAVMIGFVIPVIIVVLTIVLALYLTSSDGVYYVAEPMNQAVAAFAGLLALVPYYFGVFLSRKSLQTKLTFTLE